MIALLCVLGAFVVTFYSAGASAILWGWFIVPTLGAPVITMWQAMGIGLAYRCFIPPDISTKPEGEYGQKLIISFLYFTLVLIMGWLITKLAPGMAV